MRCLVLACLFVATTAPAQFRAPPRTTPNLPRSPIAFDPAPARPPIGRDLGDVRDRIEDGRDNGQLSRRDARRLRRGTDRIAASADRYGSDGLSTAEARELEARASLLRDQVGLARGKR
ncbi:hypothetical protein [Sphingomonas aracearum]|nr:hypothetical protein [Sphingomonas aracearum]